MNGSQTIAAAAGGGLIAANFWTSQRHAFSAGALTGGASGGDQAKAHDVVRNVAIEVLFVAVAVLLAGASRNAGGAIVAIFAALWIVWLVKHFGKGQ